MRKIASILQQSYIWIIISIFYIPIFFMTILSFNSPSAKNRVPWNNWNGFSWSSWEDLGTNTIGYAFLNSLIIGLVVASITTFIGLITVYGMWRQKRVVKNIIDVSSNIPLINPDVVTAISLSITLSAIFGALSIASEGMFRVIISHVVMILPYSILLLYPRSEKFNKSLLEASQDLGYDRPSSWLKVYVPYMMPMIIVSFGAALTLSFDDFILTRIVSNTSTIGTLLYQGEFKGWGLALGSILLLLVISGTTISLFLSQRKIKRKAKVQYGKKG